ncbi:hypothetical protein CAAN1_18S01134 [[Candida] anglica]|uniref:LisH domain-containing protein n=1 Tax=[Candida] anglica TaxID=148631 RepID=A0ABP0EM71_9ASCO
MTKNRLSTVDHISSHHHEWKIFENSRIQRENILQEQQVYLSHQLQLIEESNDLSSFMNEISDSEISPIQNQLISYEMPAPKLELTSLDDLIEDTMSTTQVDGNFHKLLIAHLYIYFVSNGLQDSATALYQEICKGIYSKEISLIGLIEMQLITSCKGTFLEDWWDLLWLTLASESALANLQ